jgi:uncharacterized protein (DUF1800 family)
MLTPLAAQQWNFTTAAHLLNRAGFGGTPQEIQDLAALGLEKATDRLVDYEKIPDPTPDPVWARPDSERAQRLAKARSASEEERRKIIREEQQQQRERIQELRYWWLQRMASGPRPLQEKLTLFWHGHFATSVEKVRDAYLMWRQNELFRRLASANWLEMLIEVAKDPAMLLWLDQAQSRKEQPNENFAREVMELFALGEGHYTEKDITEGARALTGWSYDRLEQRFVERPKWHDEGEKTIFGKTGNFGPEDFLEMIVAQPQAARLIVGRLWLFFAGEPASDAMLTALASLFRQSGNRFKPVLRAMFRSEEFYAPNLVRNQVKSPVQWLVSSVRMLERDLPPQLVSVNLIRNLGQDLLAPPNVKGWDGGLSWITTNNLLARYNEAALLVQGDTSMLSAAMLKKNPKAKPMQTGLKTKMAAVQVEKIFTEKERTDKEALVAALERRLLQSRLKPGQEKVLRDFLGGLGPLDEPDILHAIRLVMSTPEYQLT